MNIDISTMKVKRKGTSARRREATIAADATHAVGSDDLYRLMTWLSPAYPTGGFSYSSGLEWAVECGDITDADTLRSWVSVMIAEGGGLCDGVFFAHAYRATERHDAEGLRTVAELAVAFAPSKERHLETTAQGRAFLEATRAAWDCDALGRLQALAIEGPALPIVVAVACAGHAIALAPAAQCYLHALAANLVSAGVRLIPLGQSDGQRLLAALEPAVLATVRGALAASLDEVASTAVRADLASMRHESQYTRLFRS
jgi:urease accessory protein